MALLKRLALFLLTLMLPIGALALSPEAEEGKTAFAACFGCHNPEVQPPLGPPMFGIQRRYKRAYGSRDAFIQNMTAYVIAPSKEKVIMREAYGQLGLMPPLPLPEIMLHKIAAYIFEESFAPPCSHWKHAMERAKAAGDNTHLRKDRQNFQRFCIGAQG